MRGGQVAGLEATCRGRAALAEIARLDGRAAHARAQALQAARQTWPAGMRAPRCATGLDLYLASVLFDVGCRPLARASGLAAPSVLKHMRAWEDRRAACPAVDQALEDLERLIAPRRLGLAA